jgi:hypothetical protein
MTSDAPQNPEPNLSSAMAEEREKSLELNEPNNLSSPDAVNSESSSIQESEEAKLFADAWLNEPVRPQVDRANQSEPNKVEVLTSEVAQLKSQKEALESEIAALQEQRKQLLQEQVSDVKEVLEQIVREGSKELEERKAALQIGIEQLERRRDRIKEEMRTSFAGVSQDLAIRVQGFKDYLVGSLQDLAAAAEQLELIKSESWEGTPEITPIRSPSSSGATTQFAEGKFQDQGKQIKKMLDRYRTRPDYYGPPWQLRRTFEPIHAERVQDWFFTQGGRGAIKSMGSRLQNILIASTVISILHDIHGDRCRSLVLANTPERLGEWRRGLQDCLGISRGDFGPNRGVVLFESTEALVQKAERLVEEKQLPLVIIDETEDLVSLSLLQFPLWLAFAPEPQQMSGYMY